MILPMFAMCMLTIAVGFLAARARIQSVKKGELKASYFRLMEGTATPQAVTKTTRCFNNLFEVPTLFYIACVLYIVLDDVSVFALLGAWLFVGSRFIQAWIHLTHNNVRHRMFAFGLSLFSVLWLWVYLLIRNV